MELITLDDIKALLERFAKNQFQAGNDNETDKNIQETCEKLFSKDYKYNVIKNTKGSLSGSYPSRIIILTGENDDSADTCDGLQSNNSNEASGLKGLITKSLFARCRTRFPVPVILYQGKYICRSATTSSGKEIVPRMGFGLLYSSNSEETESEVKSKEAESEVKSKEAESEVKSKEAESEVKSKEAESEVKSKEAESEVKSKEAESEVKSKEYESLQARYSQVFVVRLHDINLLKALSVGYICDLMVEMKKTKFGMHVSSSEKVDKEQRYHHEFSLLNLPYPGCEFFKNFRDNEFEAKGLVFDWSQSYVDATLALPEDSPAYNMGIEWAAYRTWDLDKLTQNYIKALLKCISEDSSGVLIHCISGWDRTPLFISLLRMSLWADGKIHKSLSVNEIVYLTLAYDWYLFGHNLPDRLKKGEEVLFYCFHFLKQLMSEEFSIVQSGRDRRISGNNPEFQLGVLTEEYEKEAPESVRNSNTSLNSNSSSVSNLSQDNNPPASFAVPPDSGVKNLFNNGNLPSSTNSSEVNKLSEMTCAQECEFRTVTPTQSSNENADINPDSASSNLSSVRRRTESSSSSESFVKITLTGSDSEKSPVSTPTMEAKQNSATLEPNTFQEHHEILNLPSNSAELQSRHSKINAIRECFYQSFFSAVGVKFPETKSWYGSLESFAGIVLSFSNLSASSASSA